MDIYSGGESTSIMEAYVLDCWRLERLAGMDCEGVLVILVFRAAFVFCLQTLAGCESEGFACNI